MADYLRFGCVEIRGRNFPSNFSLKSVSVSNFPEFQYHFTLIETLILTFWYILGPMEGTNCVQNQPITLVTCNQEIKHFRGLRQ